MTVLSRAGTDSRRCCRWWYYRSAAPSSRPCTGLFRRGGVSGDAGRVSDQQQRRVVLGTEWLYTKMLSLAVAADSLAGWGLLVAVSRR